MCLFIVFCPYLPIVLKGILNYIECVLICIVILCIETPTKKMVFSCSDYDTDELKNFFTKKKKRNISDSLQDYKEIVKGMTFKDIAEAKQFCKLYAIAKKVELVMVKNDKKRLRHECGAEGCPFLLLISRDMTTPTVSVKTLVDHIECGIAYDRRLLSELLNNSSVF